MIAIIFRGESKSILRLLYRNAFPSDFFRRCTEPRNRRTATRKLTREPREKEKASTARKVRDFRRAFCRVFPRIFPIRIRSENAKSKIQRLIRRTPEFFRKREAENARTVKSTDCHFKIFLTDLEKIYNYI